MKRTAALALLLMATSSAAGPILSGLYSVGELGLVDFSVIDGKVIGKLKASAQCVFPPETQVITGAFEGSVFVGTVNLCQQGASCAGQKTYPMLGVFHGDSIAAFIHLDSGCTSPALDGKSLFFRPASLEDKQKVFGDNSAAQVAQKQSKKELSDIANDALVEGNRLYGEHNYGPAREKFKQSIQADDTRWESLLGFALTEIKLGRAQQSLEYMDRALAAATASKTSPQKTSQIYYNRACAEIALNNGKGAIASLRNAVKLGGPGFYVDDLKTDPDLQPIRNDAEFRKLFMEASSEKKKPR